MKTLTLEKILLRSIKNTDRIPYVYEIKQNRFNDSLNKVIEFNIQNNDQIDSPGNFKRH
ncbi:hypothetical protein HYE20_03105 [Mycoplasmopsis bovis]|nr:hypothetical protein [Mycoplasmopsis bovis]QQH24635.1 hypothetical protein HYE20_03105 [Mycoplasmopsis bovis]